MPVTPANVDAAVPTAGTPDRTLTNSVLKGLITDIADVGVGVGIGTVNTFADLPAPGTVSGQRWWVRTSTGVWLVNRATKGAYYSDGTTWSYLGDFPVTAAEVGFTPAAGIAATNIQAAVEEVVSDTATLLAGKASTGPIPASGLTQATNRLLGRSTAATGAVEEITLGTNLSFTGTTLNAAGGGGSIVSGSELVTSGTTWTTPADITTATRFKIVVVGGGGGGGGSAATSNLKVAGGGAGGVGVVFITGLSPSTSYTVAIGAGGAGGAAGANNGATGGNTSITISGTTYTGDGGVGAITGAFAFGGAGGTTANIPAAPSFSVDGGSGGSVGAASAIAASGFGGTPGMGFGTGGPNRSGDSAGVGGIGYGSGGGGASNGAATARAGGSGAAGCIFIEWVG